MVRLAHLKLDFGSKSLSPITRFRIMPSLNEDQELGRSGPQWLREIYEEVEALIESQELDQDTIEHASSRAADKWRSHLRANGANLLNDRQQNSGEFQRHLKQRWGRALRCYELALMIHEHIGLRLWDEHLNIEEAGFLKQVLIGLQWRATATASEVLVLLRTGHPGGAGARARTLHELDVVCRFLRKHGEAAAERYYIHQAVIEPAQVARKYHVDGIERGGLEPEDYDTLQSQYDELLREYGKWFKGDYGWACPDFDRYGEHARVNFAELEKAVGLSVARPQYKQASRGVHANVISAVANIHSLEGFPAPINGALDGGLAEPAIQALTSLAGVTLASLEIKTSVSYYPAAQLITVLLSEGKDAFTQAHNGWLQEAEAMMGAGD
jgi:hypothetical protein